MAEPVKKNSEINQDHKWNKNKERKPLYKLKKQIRQTDSELEMLKDDPTTTHDEITKLDAKLSKWKLKYAARVAALKLKMKY